ncbi:von Willebrand factor type A domain protein [Ancylostoma caninum]|uniref:von Willebrand factor type A domain protein n=1 Tax=Ancylostoma caninum TaxID=29170 RepID=A0A368GGM6_ANCCA|nr:von Willebrand factor type A domain protein [Ancylostoma caninum]
MNGWMKMSCINDWLVISAEGELRATSDGSCSPSKLSLDIVATVDTSSKMTEQGLTQVLADISTVFGETTIAQGEGSHSRFGLVTYASQARVKYNLNHFKSTEQMLEEIWNVEYIEESPSLEAGLKKALEALKSGRAGGIRKNAKPVIVIYASDFRRNDVNKSLQLAEQAQKNGTHIIVIAFKEGGKLKSLEQLEAVASPGSFFKSTVNNLGDNILSALCNIQG